MTILFCEGSVGTHIRLGGQYIHHIVGNLFRCDCAKNYGNRFDIRLSYNSYCKNKMGAVFCLFLFCSFFVIFSNNRNKSCHISLISGRNNNNFILYTYTTLELRRLHLDLIFCKSLFTILMVAQQQ